MFSVPNKMMMMMMMMMRYVNKVVDIN